MGSRWTRKLAEAARAIPGTRIFAVQIEEDADIETVSLDESIADYWRSPAEAEKRLVDAVKKQFPLTRSSGQAIRDYDLESRYREIALKACDIIDLANLPEDDRHLASKELELRKLYVALRMRLEIQANDEVEDESLRNMERRRSHFWGSRTHHEQDDITGLVSLGERLKVSKRLVVLGDPGAGKSTLLRWIATAYLLRLKTDSDWKDLPDIQSLPDAQWLPILIRCRDLPSEAVTLDAMLLHSLIKSELPEELCDPLRKLLRSKLEKGEAMLLVDGLDEITDPGARARFADQLTNIHRAISDSPIVITSRIVGYREMGYKIRNGFEHLTVADLTRADKNEFAHRWSSITERTNSTDAALSLIHDIHSSDRIERLTGNPMLLTTMALIKRKIGRLPQRRVDLYEKAVEVLLNWRNAVDAALDPREALPQLEYLAHAMCSDGIQQIREDQVLDILRQSRTDFPHIYPLQEHTPEDFLTLLERRTGLLMQSGFTRHNGRSVAIYEFRHLTLQEYLAGIALVQGHYRGRNRNDSQAEAIQHLAGQVSKKDHEDIEFNVETTVVESWREPLRLCIAASNDDVVDDSLLAILRQLQDEPQSTLRARAVLAAQCLADEPNVSDDVVQEVLNCFINVIDEYDGEDISTSVNEAVESLAISRWSSKLSEHMLSGFLERKDHDRYSHGSLYALIQNIQLPKNEDERQSWFKGESARLKTSTPEQATGIALQIMHSAYSRNLEKEFNEDEISSLADNLIPFLFDNNPTCHAIAWALGWMCESNIWLPNPIQLDHLNHAISKKTYDSEALFWIAKIFKKHSTPATSKNLQKHLSLSTDRAKAAILNTLASFANPKTLTLLKKYFHHNDVEVRRAAVGGLKFYCELEIEKKLLLWNPDFLQVGISGIDPLSTIDSKDITSCAKELHISRYEVWDLYGKLIQRYSLPLKIPTKAPRKKPMKNK
jgi:hypothetical protein